MNVKRCLIGYFILSFVSCNLITESDSPYPRMIGDIAFDAAIDGPNFELCTGDKNVIQYYALGESTYGGEKIEIIEAFNSKYDSEKSAKETGLIRIRFIVNCKGETGRFRILGMNENYEEKTFTPSITEQLLAITRGLKNWKTFERNGRKRDFYQYLIFKMEDGKIKEILP